MALDWGPGYLGAMETQTPLTFPTPISYRLPVRAFVGPSGQGHVGLELAFLFHLEITDHPARQNHLDLSFAQRMENLVLVSLGFVADKKGLP